MRPEYEKLFDEEIKEFILYSSCTRANQLTGIQLIYYIKM